MTEISNHNVCTQLYDDKSREFFYFLNQFEFSSLFFWVGLVYGGGGNKGSGDSMKF